MKKIVYFIPALIFIAFYIGIAFLMSPSIISPVIFLWIGLFITSGVVLAKGLSWGALFGLLPAVHFMYMSTVDTSQIIDIEFPTGVIIAVFYLLCGGIVLYKRNRSIV